MAWGRQGGSQVHQELGLRGYTILTFFPPIPLPADGRRCQWASYKSIHTGKKNACQWCALYTEVVCYGSGGARLIPGSDNATNAKHIRHSNTETIMLPGIVWMNHYYSSSLIYTQRIIPVRPTSWLTLCWFLPRNICTLKVISNYNWSHVYVKIDPIRPTRKSKSSTTNSCLL